MRLVVILTLLAFDVCCLRAQPIDAFKPSRRPAPFLCDSLFAKHCFELYMRNSARKGNPYLHGLDLSAPAIWPRPAPDCGDPKLRDSLDCWWWRGIEK
jgi:hypothetical protein